MKGLGGDRTRGSCTVVKCCGSESARWSLVAAVLPSPSCRKQVTECCQGQSSELVHKLVEALGNQLLLTEPCTTLKFVSI